MAARVFLLSILFTVGLLSRRSIGLELGIEFSEEPQDTVVNRNKPASLPCSSISPNVTYAWTVDHKPLHLVNTDNRITILSNGTLHFKKVLHKKSGYGVSDQGVYHCIIRNSVGALISRPALLLFASLAHEFSERPKDRTVMSGEPARFTCNIESLPRAHIVWQHNSKPLPQNNRYITLSSGVLLINGTEENDEGDYRCVAFNPALNKSRHSDEGKLIVQSNVRHKTSQVEILQSHSVTQRYIKGENVSIECVARGFPTPEVKWMKQLEYRSHEMSKLRDGINILRLFNVSGKDAGVYTCVALQKMSPSKKSVSVTKVVTIEVLSLPVFINKPKTQVFPSAKTVRFECEVIGNPQPDVIWYKDGVKLVINGRIKKKTKELVLSNSVTNDSGVYECVANNSVGTVWAAGRLRVNTSRDQPRPPGHLTCQTLSASEIQLSWDQPTSKGISAYSLHFVPTDGGEERQEVLVNQTFIVQKLPPYTNFTFYVRSYNRLASDQSEGVICRTGEGVPKGTPNITVIAESPTSLRVTWEPLPPSTALGEVSEYKVQWRQNNHPSTNVDTVPGHFMQYIITGLHADKKYDVRILAATKMGWPMLPDEQLPWTSVMTPSFQSFVPLLPAPTIQLTVINATTIQVRWNLQTDNMLIEGYRLSYRRQNAQPGDPIILPGNATEYILRNLEPQTWYEILLKGVTGGKEGEMGVRSIHTLPPLGNATRALTLSPPTNLEAVPTSPTTIDITWVPPSLPTNISYYTVSYHIVPTSIPLDNTPNFLHSTSNGVEVTGLKPYTSYEFKVRTHDHNNGHSEYSHKLECRTLEDVPGVIASSEIQWKALNASSIRVAWKEPGKTNGIIQQYTLSYSTRDNEAFDSWSSISAPGHKYSTDVNGLMANTKYFLIIRAKTKAGLGPPSGVVQFTIPALNSNKHGVSLHSTPPPLSTHNKDQFLGIILGCAIGGCCIIICMATLIYRRKCSKPGPHCLAESANGAAPCFHPSSAPCLEQHEMECLPRHLDTKGGHPNGQLNGLKLPLLSNGRIPNGHVSKDRNVRITENPQFNSPLGDLSPGSCEGMRLASDEGDSLLSGHQEAEIDLEGEGSLNETQLTHVELSLTVDCCHNDKHEAMLDDDGFHENETQRHHSVLLGPNG